MKYFCEDCGWVEKGHRCEQRETVHEIPEQALESYEAALEETVDLLQECLGHLPYKGYTWQTVADTIFKTKNELGADTMATIKLLSRWNQEKNAKISELEKDNERLSKLLKEDIDREKGLAGEIIQERDLLAHALDRVDTLIRHYGVPKERAARTARAFQVLMARRDKEENFLRGEMNRLKNPIIEIDDKTVERFLQNLKGKKFMVCFVYYDFKIGEKSRRMLDIAKTRYSEDFGWSIQCRGTCYLDHFFLNDEKIKEPYILKYIHSFIECEEPEIKGK